MAGLAIIVPTANRPRLISRAIEMVRRRRPCAPVDWAIVDASVDLETCDACVRAGFFERDAGERVRVNVGPGTSVGAMMNAGAGALPEARVFVKCDDDDIYLPGWYEASAEAAFSSPSGVACAADWYAWRAKDDAILRWLCFGRDVSEGHWSGGTLAFTREAWERAPFQEIRGPGTDREFVRDAVRLSGKPCAVVPGAADMYCHVRHGVNLTGPCQNCGTLASAEQAERVRETFAEDLAWLRAHLPESVKTGPGARRRRVHHRWL